jgi:hypothetical protein
MLRLSSFACKAFYAGPSAPIQPPFTLIIAQQTLLIAQHTLINAQHVLYQYTV